MTRLARANGRLLVGEIRQTAGVVGRRAVLFVPAVALCVVGTMLLVAGAGLYVGHLLGKPWLGFLLVGGLAVATGGALAWWAVRSLSSVDLGLPVTMSEIQKDLKWLKDRLKDD